MASLHSQRGFTVTELLLVLGVGTLIIAAAFAGYGVVSDSNTDRANALATTNLLVSVKNKWWGVGSYDGVTAASVYAAGLVVKPYSFTPPNTLLNGYGLWANVSGSGGAFSLMLNVPINKCIDMVAALDRVAYSISVDGAEIKNATTPLADWNGSCGPGTEVMLIAWVK